MHNSKAPSFLSSFFGSFLYPGKYPRYIERGGFSFFGHYCLIIVLCCSFYAFLSTSWLHSNVTPHLADFAASVPTVSLTDGKVSVDVEQPHFFKVDGKVFGVIDTTQDPSVHLEDEKIQFVLSEEHFTVRSRQAKTEAYKLAGTFSVDSDAAFDIVEKIDSWFLPTLFLLSFIWQFGWKFVQALIVATVVTLVQQSRPGFSQHLKLSLCALGPAMVFGVVVFAVELFVTPVPGTGFMFWMILGGLTYVASNKLKTSPSHS